jgi:hypothetical protein
MSIDTEYRSHKVLTHTHMGHHLTSSKLLNVGPLKQGMSLIKVHSYNEDGLTLR